MADIYRHQPRSLWDDLGQLLDCYCRPVGLWVDGSLGAKPV